MSELENHVQAFKDATRARFHCIDGTGMWMLHVGYTARGYPIIICGDRKPRHHWHFRFHPTPRGGVKVRVGCRWFSLGRANRHWTRLARSRLPHAKETLALIDIGLRDAAVHGYCAKGIKVRTCK